MSDASCSVEGISLESAYSTEVFENTGVVRWMSNLPRFGFGSELLDLINGTGGAHDYLRGIFASSVAVAIFFLVWLISLGVFCCLGQRKVGFLSGRQAEKPKLGKAKSEEPAETPTGPQTLEALRVWVMFACTSIILSSIILCTRAVGNLTDGLDTTRDVLSLGQDRLQQGIDLIDTMVEAQSVAQMDYQNLITDATSSCAALPMSLCNDETLSVEDCLLSLLPIDGDVDAVLEVLRGEPGGTFIFPEVVRVRQDLVDSKYALSRIDVKAETFTRVFHAAMAFAIVMSAFSIIIMVAVAFAWLEKFPFILQMMLKFAVLPLFLVFVYLSQVLTFVFISGSYILADFCVDSPDRHVLALVSKFEDELTPMISNFITYYVRGCPIDLLPTSITTQFDYVISLLPAVNGITDAISTTQALADQFCSGNGSFLATFGDASNRQICNIAGLLSDSQGLFECSSIRPLYELSAYDAICYSGTNGFSWIGSTQFIIVFMSLSILTCRIVLYPTWEEGDDESDDDTRQSPPSPGSSAKMPTPTASNRSRSRVFRGGTDEFEVGYNYRNRMEI